jgi:hypothetical protein
MGAGLIKKFLFRKRECAVKNGRLSRVRAYEICVTAVCVTGLFALASPFLKAQEFEPTLTVGGGIQGSYDHNETNGSASLDRFSLNHARLYFSGGVTKDISVMFNTEYNSNTDTMQILDFAGMFSVSPKVNVWFGRFLPPSDRANLYGPFYANEWDVYTDGIQDGYPFVFQGRDNGAMYWGDFKAGTATVKVAAGAFDGNSATSSNSVIWGSRVQIDFWDPENGWYQNGTYYGDKNLLALSGATEVQSGKTATTVDFLMERKVQHGGAFTVESEYARYNGLGGYDSRYVKSEGAYGLASFLFPKAVGMGKFELLGKYAIAEFTDGGIAAPPHPSYRQNTAEINVNYVIKQFDARVMSFYRDARFNAVNSNNWQAGVGVQLQLSKKVH